VRGVATAPGQSISRAALLYLRPAPRNSRQWLLSDDGQSWFSVMKGLPGSQRKVLIYGQSWFSVMEGLSDSQRKVLIYSVNLGHDSAFRRVCMREVFGNHALLPCMFPSPFITSSIS